MAARKHIPPRLATRLLTWLLRDDLAEEVLGDLEEKFFAVAEKKSLFRARLNYWYQALNYLRPFAIRRTKVRHSNHIAMFRHNLIITFRGFRKNKGQFVINLSGLSVGIACALMIYLWASSEFEMNRYHEKGDRMYQVLTNHEDAGKVVTQYITPGLLLEAVQDKVPEVEKATAWLPHGEAGFFIEGSYHKAAGMFASKDYFSVFTHPLIAGDPGSALADKSSIVISELLSKRLFGDISPIGKSVEWHFQGLSKTLEVTGLMGDVPDEEPEPFDYLMSWDYYHDDLRGNKRWTDYYALITLLCNDNAGVSGKEVEPIEAKINAILEENGNDRVSLKLAKYEDLYLHDNFENGELAGGKIEYVYLIIIVGVFILLIASVNFINLSTANAMSRSQSVGVKKFIGASRGSLVGQYLTESMVISFLSFLVALFGVWIFLPYFNRFFDRSLELIWSLRFVMIATGIMLLIGLLAGSYPAVYLSRLSTRIKSSMASGKEAWARKILVVFQFIISITLMGAVLVVYQQMDYIRNKNIGYNKDNLLQIKREGKLMENADGFLAELKRLPGVDNAALNSFKARSFNWTGAIQWEGKSPDDRIQFHQLWGGNGLVETMQFNVLKGRSFSPDFQDFRSIILNESAVAAIGLEDPVGKTIQHWTGEKQVIGVIQDYHFRSLRTEVGPSVILNDPQRADHVGIRLSEETNILEMLEKVEEVYHEFNPGYVFEPQFVDHAYQEMYNTEQQVSMLIAWFAVLAILISCLGLFGLSIFTTQRRTKEIGIRKVLGLGIYGVVFLLSKDFSRMVLLAAAIAVPISYLLAERWLENFAYHIDLNWWLFVVAGFVALVVALLTVSYQALKTAITNPVNSLRSE